MLAPLNAALFTLGNDHVTVADLVGFVTGAASVWLTVLARISNFPVGIANSAFFFGAVLVRAALCELGFAGRVHRTRVRRVVAVAAWRAGPDPAGCGKIRLAVAGRVHPLHGPGDLGPDGVAAEGESSRAVL